MRGVVLTSAKVVFQLICFIVAGYYGYTQVVRYLDNYDMKALQGKKDAVEIVLADIRKLYVKANFDLAYAKWVQYIGLQADRRTDYDLEGHVLDFERAVKELDDIVKILQPDQQVKPLKKQHFIVALQIALQG